MKLMVALFIGIMILFISVLNIIFCNIKNSDWGDDEL